MPPETSHSPPARAYDVVVVGAGPAGMAATVRAAEAGLRVALVDDNPDLGGQIWRGERTHPTGRDARTWFGRIEGVKFDALLGTRVVGLGGPNALIAERDGSLVELDYGSLILAAGARELFLPFPGWTLPGVLGAGGMQALVKSGLAVRGKRIVVAGSGPLLLAVASALRKHGAIIPAIVEQAPWPKLARFGLGLWAAPGKVGQAVGLKASLLGVPYRAGWWPVEATGDDRSIRAVTITDGRRTLDLSCDFLACGFGLIPNLELPSLLGCDLGPDAVRVDDFGQTSVPGVYSVGELTGIGGLEPALLEGEVAGYAAAGRDDAARALLPARGRALRFARALERAFAPRAELRSLPRADTIVCRCEDVTAGQVAGRSSWVDAKLQTRCGMGPCQGRICGGATTFLYGWSRGSVRPPIFPVAVANLAEAAVMLAPAESAASPAR